MKRVICIIFALLLMLALCACEGDAYIYIGNTDSGTSQSSGTDGTVNSNITASSVIEGNGDGQADFVAPDNSFSNTSSTTSEDKKGGFLGFIGDLLGGNKDKDKDKDKNSSSPASSSENTTTETSSETSAPTSSNTTTDSSKEESKPVSSSSQQTSSVPTDPFENSSNWVIVDIPQK